MSQLQARRHVPAGLQLMHAAAHYQDEEVLLPRFYQHHFNLFRSVSDMVHVDVPKRLPIMADIMSLAAQVEADYYLYTNIDIALQPHFYTYLFPYLQQGYQGLIINRRRIPARRESYASLSRYSTHWGRSHPGFDCFVMSATVMKRLVLGNICVGVPFVGVAMAHNIFAYARPWHLFEHEDLTFHLGMEIYKPQLHAYYWHNRKQFFTYVKPRVWHALLAEELPYGRASWWLRYWKWALNPSLFVGMNARLEMRRFPFLAHFLP